MNWRPQNRLIRSSRGLRRFEYFFIAAISTILGVRLFLEVTGYPKIGGESSIHLAHVLWGGLLMAIAIATLFFFLNRGAEFVAALAGGAGFGLFMDEVGKFVTQNNDYFFQPAVAIMYVTFVVFYLAARFIMTGTYFSRTELLTNAINEMKDIPAGRFRENVKEEIVAMLTERHRGEPLAHDLLDLLRRIDAAPAAAAGPYERFKARWTARYRRIAASGWFRPGISAFFILQMAAALVTVLAVLFDIGSVQQQINQMSFSDWAILVSNFISIGFIVWGVLLLWRSRLRAFRMFERSLLIAIFITQFFLFYTDEFGALPGFCFDLLLLMGVRFIIQSEGGGRPRAVTLPLE